MKIFKNKQGVSLLIVVMYFLVLTLLLAGLFAVSMSNFKNQNTADAHTTAYYVAESGINVTIAQFEDEIQALFDLDLSTDDFYTNLDTFIANLTGVSYTNDTTDHFSLDIGQANATIDINKLGEQSGYYEIISTGVVNNVSRTLRKVLFVEYALDPGNGFTIDKAILTTDIIDIDRSSLIDASTCDNPNIIDASCDGADISTYSTIINTVNVNSSSVINDIYLLPGTSDNIVKDIPDGSLIIKDLEYSPFPQINFMSVDGRAQTVLDNPANSKSSLNSIISNGSLQSGTFYINTLTFNSNTTINVPSNTFIVTNSIVFGSNYKNITFTGEGKLEIYVGNPSIQTPINANLFANINNGVNIGNSSDPTKFIVYVSSFLRSNLIPTIQFGNNSIFNGSLMLENTNVNFSNNSAVNGYLVTGGSQVTIANNSALTTKGLIFVPNGTVTMSNKSYYSGAIVSKNFYITKGTLIYNPLNFSSIPSDIIDPINQGGFTGGYVLGFDYGSTTEVD